MSQRPSVWRKPPGGFNSKVAMPPHLRGGSGPASQLNSRGANAQANHRAGQSVRSDSVSQFPCPFPDCDETFPTNALLIKHKASPDSGHDYCKICDLDFEDDDAYHIHKMSSDKHITCHICSEDFRSEAGCKRHMSQMHATQQNIKCRGCSKLFLQGAALMAHIERSQCPVIHKAEFETQRAMVALTMEHLTKVGEPDLQMEPALTDDPLDDGGVRLEVGSIAEDDDLLGGSVSGASTVSAPRAVSSTYGDAFPALSGQSKGKGIAQPEELEKDENVSSNNPPWANRFYPNAPKTPAPPGWTSNTEFEYRSSIDPMNGQRSHFRLADIKRDVYTGMFHCPMKSCESGPYPSLDLLEAHLGSGMHKGVSNRCVGCLRIFKSPSALTAHMESSSERCRVRESRHFGNALNLVSGGYLGVNGRHADGSIKIDTPESPMPIIW